MRFKLDENLSPAVAERFAAKGYSVETVVSQSLCGASDTELIAICQSERRCLVTLDLDFANPLVFPPNRYSGIVALRLQGGGNPAEQIDALIQTLLIALESDTPDGKLWIVEIGRIRIYQPPTDDD